MSGFFWQEPSDIRAKQSRKAAYNAQTWYIENRWTMVLDEILARIYIMRCQLVHGAATYMDLTDIDGDTKDMKAEWSIKDFAR